MTKKLSQLKISAGETLTIYQPMLAGGMLGGQQVSPHPGNESNLEEKSLLTLSEAPFTTRAAPESGVEYKLYDNADEAIAAFLRSKNAETHLNHIEKDLSQGER